MNDTVAAILEPLTKAQDTVLSAVARVFHSSPQSLFLPEGGKETAPARESLALLAARGDGLWLARIHAALVEIDKVLLEQSALTRPGACRYASMLAAFAALKAEERVGDTLRMGNASRSPILTLDRSTLFAAPVGPLGDTGMTAFVDRLLREIQAKRPRKLVVHLQGLDPADQQRWQALKIDDELAALRCKLGNL